MPALDEGSCYNFYHSESYKHYDLVQLCVGGREYNRMNRAL